MVRIASAFIFVADSILSWASIEALGD